MKTRIILLFGAIFINSVTSINKAQINITGNVSDSNTSEYIEFANIVLLGQDSSFVAGASSDDKGLFAFNNVPSNNYIVSATFVGYEKTYVSVSKSEKDMHIGNIILRPSAVALQDVTVTANAVIQKPDRKLIMPSTAQIKASSNGVTLLRNLQLSRVIVNPIDNTIKVPSGEAVQLRINGVEVTTAEITAINPADIVRIEYHDDPGMRYGNAAAVIDYITRRKDSGGSIMADLGYGLSDIGWGENTVSAKANHKKSEFGVNTYWHRRNLKWTRENHETFVLPSKTLERTEIGSPTRVAEDGVNSAVNYSLLEADKYMFNVTFRNSFWYRPNNFSDRNSIMRSSDSNKEKSISDHSTWKSNSPSLDVYYQRNLKNNQLVIANIVGTYIDSKSTRDYKEDNVSYYSHILGDKYSIIGEGIYEKGFEAGKLSAGLKHTQSYTKNAYGGSNNDNVNLKFAETYAFTEYQFRKNKFNYTFGLGIMRNYNSQGEKSNEKYILRPTIKVAYNVNDYTSIRYHGYVSGYSPSLSDLNDVQLDIDSLQVRRGNSGLKTVTYTSHTINAGYHKGIFGCDLWVRYNYDHKPIMEQITFGKTGINDEEKFIRTNVNHKSFHRLNAQLSLSLKPFGDYLSIAVRPGVNRYISNGNDFTHTYTNWRLHGSIYANYKKWMVGFEGGTRWNNFWGESLEIGERFHAIFAGYNAQKWSLSLASFNPFEKTYTNGNRNYSKLASNVSNVYSDNLSNIFVLKATINLNFGRQFNGGGKRLNNDDTDAGVMSGAKK